jgi:hypothetical protein
MSRLSNCVGRKTGRRVEEQKMIVGASVSIPPEPAGTPGGRRMIVQVMGVVVCPTEVGWRGLQCDAKVVELTILIVRLVH